MSGPSHLHPLSETKAGRPPLWLRGLAAIDSALRRAQMFTTAVTEELALALLPEGKRSDVTRDIYARSPRYLAGGGTFEQGLFEWEIAAISASPFPSSGRILLGGAGGGRELKALIGRGYEVVAFEPSEALAQGAMLVAAPGRAVVVIADYGDLVRAIERHSGPLMPQLSDMSFDGVILGWGSLSHVLGADERSALFRALRTLAPTAPVLLSYLAATAPVRGRRLRVRKALARLTSNDLKAEARFLPWAGFFHTLSQPELERLASETGYGVVWNRPSPYSHALLIPLEPSGKPTRTKTGSSELYSL